MSDADDAPPRLEDQLCFALHAASRAVTRAYRPALEALGVTYTQYVTLMVLWERDGLTVGELGERLRLDSGTLTPLLKRLERDGLVTRARDPDDERRLRVHLTRAGADLSGPAREVRAQLACALDAPGVGDADALRARLVALVDALDALDAD
jgi:DNA-binding MarR family transcriptional regulator